MHTRTGPLLVKSTEGTVHSRVGCKVTLVCSGVGKVIMWIIDGDRVENDTNIRITVSYLYGMELCTFCLNIMHVDMDKSIKCTCTYYIICSKDPGCGRPG